MRRLLFLLSLFCFILPVFAQDDEPTPYEIALQRIQQAEASGADQLNLSGLGLTELPPEIGSLTSLEHLILRRNQLQFLPPEIGDLSNLIELDLSSNQVQNLPPEIDNLTNLQWLWLDNNELTTLVPEIGNLSKLLWLRIRYNQVMVLPPEIGNLNNLRGLDLDSNQLSSLPSEIGNLTNLCYLNISFNQFLELPNQIGKLRGLTTSGQCYYHPHSAFLFEHNPLISPPQSVIDQGTPAILDYLENEAWWHLQRLIIGGATGFGVVAAFILGMRWRNRGKKKRA